MATLCSEVLLPLISGQQDSSRALSSAMKSFAKQHPSSIVNSFLVPLCIPELPSPAICATISLCVDELPTDQAGIVLLAFLNALSRSPTLSTVPLSVQHQSLLHSLLTRFGTASPLSPVAADSLIHILELQTPLLSGFSSNLTPLLLSVLAVFRAHKSQISPPLLQRIARISDGIQGPSKRALTAVVLKFVSE